MIEYELEYDEMSLVCLYDEGRIIYIQVERDPEPKYTGVSIIKRILNDKHMFIGDMYGVQSYFAVKYIDDSGFYPDVEFSGADRNTLTVDELDSYLDNNDYNYIYVYDVQKDILIIKEPDIDLYHLDFHNRSSVQKYIDSL